MKKIFALGISFLMTMSLLVGCNSNSNTKTDSDKISIGMITDVGGINDGSFNESAWKGLKKAQEDFNIDITYLESINDSDYVPHIETFIDQEMDLILAVGYKLTDSIKEAANNYPEQKFAIIDGEFGNEEIPSNVKNIMFNEQEGAFLAGIIAASTSKTNRVGFIGGMEAPVVDRYKYGYLAGVHTFSTEQNKDIKISATYANSFTDQAKGKAIANQMISENADIIFHAAGPVGNGMFEALKEKGLLGIGVDTDQSKIAPETVLTSAIKNLDVASYDIAKEVYEDNFEGGKTLINTLSNDGVGIIKSNEQIAVKYNTLLEEYSNRIISGDLKVPATLEEYEEFIKPQ